VVTDDPEEKLVPLDRAQGGDPSGELAGIIRSVLERWACGGGDFEQVVVEAEEVGQCLLRCGERCQSWRYWWFEFVVILAVECGLVTSPRAVAGPTRRDRAVTGRARPHRVRRDSRV